MEGVGDIFTISVDNVRVGDNGDPVISASFRGLDPVHAETSGKARDTTENAFKGLTQMMTNIILEHLEINGYKGIEI